MARSFNGTSDFINCGNSSTLNPTGALTVSVWTLLTGLSGSQWVVARDDNALGRSFSFGTVTTNFTLQVNGANQISSAVGASGVWQHRLFTGNGGGVGATTYAGYLNGVASGGGTTTGPLPAATTGNFTIGERTFAASQGFVGGRIAEAAIWNIVLTAGEISALAKGARPNTIRRSALLGWWPIDGIQSPEPDFSGNKNNGTLTGTAFVTGPPVRLFSPYRPTPPEFIAPPLGTPDTSMQGAFVCA